MFSEDEVRQNTDALEQLPRSANRRSVLSERRQAILQQKQAEKYTDALPALTNDSGPGVKATWRQMAQLREENKRLRGEGEELRMEMQQLLDIYGQEIATYQQQLQSLFEERDQLYEANTLWAQRYAELEAMQSRSRQDADHYTNEALHMKREVQRIAVSLEEERKLLNEERQQFHTLHYSMLEQLKERQHTLNARLYDRWRVISLATSLGLLAMLVLLQFVLLAFFSIALTSVIAFVLITPIVICVALAFLFAGPAQLLRHAYMSAPRRKKSHAL